MFSNYKKHTILLCALAAMFAGRSMAQPKDLPKDLYLAATIPDSLKQDANAVIRYSNDEYVVTAPGKAVTKHFMLVTALNEKADHFAYVGILYNKKYDKINDFEMKIFDANGKLIKKYTKSDMYDRSAVDESTIVTDDRALYVGHTIASYPATIQISYENNISSFIDLGEWHIQPSEVAVQTSVCKISAAVAVGFRYKAKNIKLDPFITEEGGLKKYQWQIHNLKAVKPEEEAPRWSADKSVSFATDKFEFLGRPGDINSWENFGKWVQGLNADVNTLPPQRAEEIRQMVAGQKTDKDKARFLYNYLQESMRYVCIQLGIGGFKPFAASFVDQQKYGDCKALSNYMYALLKAVNIPAYYALINAGANAEPADPNFSNDPFNHAILCIPFKNDTTWLECTSNTQPFGKLGTFTENRRALLITETGGKLVNTPRSTMDDNTFSADVHIILGADGGAKAKAKLTSTGEYRSMYVDLASAKADQQKEFLIRYLNIKQPSAFSFTTSDNKSESKELNLDLDYDRFCDMAAGEKQFYRPRVFDLWRLTIPETEKRRSDYYFEHPMKKICTTTIDLPAGFEVESLPANVNLKFSYGNYDITYKYDAAKNQVVSVNSFNLTNQVIPAAKYTEMQQYMDNIAKAQNKKLVIRHKAS